MNNDTRITRRQWFIRAGRLAAGGALATVAAVAGFRSRGRQNASAPSGSCDPQACTGCTIASTCNLPAAEQARGERQG